jgi:HlyD family secretion protein
MTATTDGSDGNGLPLRVVERTPDTAGVRQGARSARSIAGRFAAALALASLLGLGAILIARLLAGPLAPVVAPAEAPPSRPPTVLGLGRIVPEGDVLTLAPPFGAGDARIAALHVDEGDRVAAGALLATMDNERPLAAAVESARATVAAREAVLAQVRVAVRAGRDEARAALARAEATARNADRAFLRTETLRARETATDATVDQRRAARDEAAREIERQRATLSRYDADDPEAQADVVVARRNLDAARTDLARADADLDKAHVRAPRAGTVLTLHARPGERPGALGILTFGDVDAMTVEIEIHQSTVGRIAVGDTVEIASDALPRRLAGTVTRIGMEVVRQALVDTSPAANTDARVVRVTARLDAEGSTVARAFTNLQVRARIAVRTVP